MSTASIIQVSAAWPDLLVFWDDSRAQIINVERLIELRPSLEPLRQLAVFSSARPSAGGGAVEFDGGLRIDGLELQA
jgi:hypothetical protein